jgi:uncharacterized membrane protein
MCHVNAREPVRRVLATSREELTPGNRLLARVVLLFSLGAALSRGRSLLPRTNQDQALITAGAGAYGALTGLLTEGAVTLLARPLGRRRLAAAGLLGAVGGLGFLADRKGLARGNVSSAAAAGAQVLGTGALGGELAVGAWGLVPRRQRNEITNRAVTAAISAGSAAAALRSKLSEPSDLVKATIIYDRLETVSGGEGSLLPLENIDREGRKFLGCAASPELIAEVMGEDDVKSPIRVFAGLGSADTPEDRARLAVEELERLGGLERKRVIVYSPAGTGLVNPVAPEVEEFMMRGDVASLVVQYSQKRSMRARKDLELAGQSFRLTLEELGKAIGRRNGGKPELVVYGESLGAWAVAQAIAAGGSESIRGLGIDRGAILGLPYPARVKLRKVQESGDPLPDGIAILSNLDEVVTLPREEQEKIRYLVYTHPEDPVGNFEGVSMAWRRPAFLQKGKRHKRIPGGMRWYPVITFLQLLFDLKNGTGSVGTFSAYGHDYRLELPALLRIAWGHGDVTDRQLRAIEDQTQRSADEQTAREDRARVGMRAKL